ncbi:tRNA glutamyl-Q(34) synthetase GluQRS [Olsenella massiliensis]|uniref:tRNA glutamyl-Q(34) synthetase GluQRS n=1 Tax=Olsenella massiliensis TaxID=1622075 RepID=UPI00071D9FE0|nr:tRNA glutamyl-Q(34) synthetase GluQRS [Olsenella massiliensis]
MDASSRKRSPHASATADAKASAGGPCRGRFAPTPSGRMHLGNAFVALLSWLSVRSQGGTLVLRVEDLDPRTRQADAAELLMRDLDWLGLCWDEGPFYQSERGELYRDAIDRLERDGLTYPCFCSRSELHAASAPHASDGTYVYRGTCRHLSAQEVARRQAQRPPALRLRVPDEGSPGDRVEFVDLCCGACHELLSRDCGDVLVRRSDGIVAYQLAVTVDDGLMGVSEVVRGHDLLGSTARQMYIARLLGLEPPRYAHVPLLVAPDGRRLSKRDRALGLDSLRAAGVSPRRVTGALASLAGLASPGEELAPADLVSRFDWDVVRRCPPQVTVRETLMA